MKYGRIMIAAPKSGSGKTIITCGLLAWLRDRGIDVRSYKCGPDYIDPMFHRKVIGVPGGNLDTFFSSDQELRNQIAAADCEASVIEGVMGIYDGITGAGGKGSCYDVAAATGTPVILIMDVKGMGQTMLSVIKGILSDDKCCLIRGIVLNRISARYFEEMRPLIENMLAEISEERGTAVELIGGIPNVKDIRLESRHLGLMMPDEISDLSEQVTAAKELISENLDTDKLLKIMREAQSLKGEPSPCHPRSQVTLAVARDEAFCFYYEENIRLLESMGIKIREFSPIHDEALPEDADGLLIGGGYPELYAEKLSSNGSMRASIRSALEGGMPSLAECGGFMYLLDSMTDDEGHEWPMCGAVRGSSHNTGKLGRFGYITITSAEDEEDLLSRLSIRGHEFHYFDSDNNGEDALAVKPGTGKSWKCIHAGDDHLWGYPHLYYPSCPEFVSRFRDAMLRYREKNNG